MSDYLDRILSRIGKRLEAPSESQECEPNGFVVAADHPLAEAHALIAQVLKDSAQQPNRIAHLLRVNECKPH